MEIEKLLKLPESKILEFKRDLSSLPSVLKTIVAFANTAGGILIIGCAERKAIGLENVFKEEERLASAIADSIHPPLLPELEIATVQGKDLLIVKIAHWKGPFYVKKEGIPSGVYIRLGSTSRPAGPEMISQLQRSVVSLSFDQGALPDLTMESLNLEKAEQTFKKIGKSITKNKLQSLGILVSHGGNLVPSIGGMILFGKLSELHQYLPDVRVRCARFLGNNKANILDQFEVEGTILDAIDEVPKFISRNTRLAAEFKEIRRRDIPEYPTLAIREVLINALVHTDYSVQGSHIQIAIYDDRLEIQNPGMLPFGYTLDDFKAGVSRIRNRVIAKVFHELNFMEEWGSGFKRCREDCKRGGYAVPQWQELGAFVRVTFFPHSQTKDEPRRVTLDPAERQKAILSLFTPELSLSFREIFNLLSGSISERTLRHDLSILKKKKLLASSGKGRAILWQLIN